MVTVKQTTNYQADQQPAAERETSLPTRWAKHIVLSLYFLILVSLTLIVHDINAERFSVSHVTTRLCAGLVNSSLKANV